jgi:tetratricopeptide (TPR) repeat protein
LQLSLIEGDYAEGAHVLGASRYEKFNDIGVGGSAAVFDGFALPRAWFEGLIARGRGELETADRAFAAAQRIVEAELTQSRDDAKTLVVLGVLQAMRGQKDDAVSSGRHAVELLSISKDAYDGPLIATKLAVIYAEIGEVDRAIELLADLVESPNGPTAGALRVEPEWESLRRDPRFERLINTVVAAG